MRLNALYNDFEPYTAKLLQLRIDDGWLPPGEVLSEDVRELCKTDLSDYGQVHLYAGIGGFPLACRMAGLPDDFRLQTGGFPCQPFSTAGRRRGPGDNRYLWPQTLACLKSHRPDVAIYENVAGLTSVVFPGEKTLVGMQALIGRVTDYIYKQKGLGVLNNITQEIEAAGYAVQAFVVPACGVAAPHERARLWIVAYARHLDRRDKRAVKAGDKGSGQRAPCTNAAGRSGLQPGIFPDARHPKCAGREASSGKAARYKSASSCRSVANRDGQRQKPGSESGDKSRDGVGDGGQDVANNNSKPKRAGFCESKSSGNRERRPANGCSQGGDVSDSDDARCEKQQSSVCGQAQFTASERRCRWSPEPGVGRVVDGLSGRVDRIKGLGNAIVPQVACEIITMIMASLGIAGDWQDGFAPESDAA